MKSESLVFSLKSTIYKNTATMQRTNLILALIMIFLFSCKTNSPMINNQTIKELDVERYMGTWYELARFNHRFEKGLVGVTATYSLSDNGKINVVNAGYKNSLDGKYSKAKAKAKIPNPAEPGKLKVYFVPFFGANYYILEIDAHYQWVLVGSSSPNYLWIMSRTPALPDATYQMIVSRAKARGYATEALIQVVQ